MTHREEFKWKLEGFMTFNRPGEVETAMGLGIKTPVW